MTTDRDGNVYVAGEGTSDSSPHALGWVRKYDPSGNQLGEQSPGWGSPRVATDADGDLYVEAYDSYDQGWSLSKYSAGGDRAWTLGYAIESKDNPGYPYGVAADSAGSVYVTGSTLGSDAWLAKWDTAGNELWRRRLGTAKGDGAWGRGIATDRNGNVYITGGTEGSLGGRNRGASDAWLAKYGPGGKVLWKEQLGTSRSEEGAAVATDLDGNIYVAGSTEGSLGGANRGGSDAFAAKFAAR